MKVLLAYFSATGNTAEIAETINNHLATLGADIDTKNITSIGDRKAGLDLSPYQAVIFGAPIHSSRAPRIVRDWMNTLDGNGKPCATFFTYGGFGVHPTHHSTRVILEGRGFDLVASAEFPGKHTFNIAGWAALTNRPNTSDLTVAKAFAESCYKRFSGEDGNRPGEFNKTEKTEAELDAMEQMRFKAVKQLPSRLGKECSMCMLCEELCPTHTMNAEKGEVMNARECLCCLRCIANCPEDALSINDLTPMFSVKLDMSKETEASLNEKKSRLYL